MPTPPLTSKYAREYPDEVEEYQALQKPEEVYKISHLYLSKENHSIPELLLHPLMLCDGKENREIYFFMKSEDKFLSYLYEEKGKILELDASQNTEIQKEQEELKDFFATLQSQVFSMPEEQAKEVATGGTGLKNPVFSKLPVEIHAQYL